jgi:hypothetical protein
VTLHDGYFTIFEHSGHHPYLEETGATSGRIIAFLASK